MAVSERDAAPLLADTAGSVLTEGIWPCPWRRCGTTP